MTDYFFTNIEPTLIVVEHPVAHQNKSTSQQPVNEDTVSQQTHPQQPEETRIHPSMLITRRNPRSKRRVNNYPIVIHQMKRQIHDSVHQKKKENMGQ